MDRFVAETANTEKLLLFSETAGGKTRFYLKILQWLSKKGVKADDMLMYIIYPDRPGGLTSLYGFIPKEYQSNIKVLIVSDYEQLITASATAIEGLEEHYKKTGKYGWLVFELCETFWTFSQDYYCRKAYGETMADYFSQMQSILGKDKAEKGSAYESFAGPFGGPWPIIKFYFNFYWIDRLKRLPYNIIFTSELKEEENKDSVFSDLGFRPAGEKHLQHKMDTILYLSHKGNSFYLKPYKITGYEKLYGQLEITGKNGYEVHKDALKRLEELGYKVTKFEELEKEAGIIPPKPKPKVEKPETIIEQPKEEKTVTVINKEGETKISKEEVLKTVDNDKLLDKVIKEEKVKKEKPKEVKKAEEDEWNI